MKNTRLRKAYVGITSTVMTIGVLGSPLAFAETGTGAQHSYRASLTALNKSDDVGNASTTVTTNGDGTFTVKTTGASPSLAHAQHIHVGGTHTCPDISADKDGDGLINTTEGTPSYGPIEISLTTSGDTSKDSGLAVDRFPVADANGNVNYERTFPLPTGVTEDMIAQGVVVTHGVSELSGDKAKYDGDKKSDIPKSESLPLEATIPAACGKLVSMTSPSGGVAAGGGSTMGIENSAAFGVGLVALAAAGGLAFTSRKRSV
ncbi:MAG: hypothetical protein QFB86_02520 [Patescibacteria group bacterium]|nr:hypothetical protein [Patescibacteria group bacterium]